MRLQSFAHGPQHQGAPSAADAMVLATMIERGSFAILAGTPACIQKWVKQPVMRRDDRSRLLELGTLGVPELAEITVQLVVSSQAICRCL
jgi:hypothetical protein